MDKQHRLEELAAAQWRLAIRLTVAMIVIYSGFVLLVAFAKPFLGTVLLPGLSLGILLGALVIVSAWVLIFVYVRWANRHYDTAVDALRAERS